MLSFCPAAASSSPFTELASNLRSASSTLDRVKSFSFKDHLQLWSLVGFVLIVSNAAFIFISWNDSKAAKPAQAYETLPGIEIEFLTAPQRSEVIRTFNTRFCTCDCFRTMASCLNNHKSCPSSVVQGREMLKQIRSHFK